MQIYRNNLAEKAAKTFSSSATYSSSTSTSAETTTPLRSRILTSDQFVQHGAILAENFNSKVDFFSTSPSQALRARFEENKLFLKNSYIKLTAAAKEREQLSSGAEWLLDNYHVIDQQIRQIKKNYTKGYDKTLPKLKLSTTNTTSSVTDINYSGYPRIYELATNLISHSDAIVEEEYLSCLLRGYQSKSALTIGELWATPIMVKFALIENLSRLIRSIMVAREEKFFASSLIDSLFIESEVPATQLLMNFISQIESHPQLINKTGVFLIRKLREKGAKAVLSLQWLEEKLREQSLEPDELIRNDHQLQALDQISIGNTVTSLKNIGSINWEDWVESNSYTHRILLKDPAKFYQLSDFKTRNNLREKIEVLSRGLKIAEEEIAEKLIDFVDKVSIVENEANLSSYNRHLIGLKKHVGYYLIGKGKSEFQKSIGYNPKLLTQLGRFLSPISSELYFISIFILTFIFVYLAKRLLPFPILYIESPISNQLKESWSSIFLLCLLVIPASDIAIGFIQWFLSHLVKPESLPKYDFSKEIPESAKTLVAVQAIFEDKHALARSIEALETKHIANDDKNLLFAIVADFPDRKVVDPNQDIELLHHGNSLINELNKKYGFEKAPKFFVLFRERAWNDKEDKYMAWERKRGKVCELNKLILAGTHGRSPKTSFIESEKFSLAFKGIKYVITLDTDTQLPFGTAQKLVGAIAHPLNKAVFDPKKRVVVDGYGIIQARVGISLISANATRFSKIFAGVAGLDPYTSAIADFYQDIFGEGSFYGKGIYDVETFEKAIAGRVPENAILSHDLFEGLFARVGYCSDVEVIDEFPGKYTTFAKRQHRWVRGDWQLFPWLRRIIPNETYERYRSPLTRLERWKLIDNLRRSLIAPTLLAFNILGTLLFPQATISFLTISLLAVAFPVYTNVAQIFIMPPLGYSLSIFAKGFSREILRLTQQALLSFAFLPHQAYLMLHAIFVTLKRVYFTKKNLLEWQTAYYSEKKSSSDLSTYYNEMKLCPIFGILMILHTALFANGFGYSAIVFFSIWVFAPWIARELGKEADDEKEILTQHDREYLLEIARRTWNYFKEHSLNHNNLIPDNVQVHPKRVEADRTSPTNIAMYLVSCLGAYELGFETITAVIDKIESCLQSTERLEKHRGHLLNWYQTRTLQPLHPRYVSVVDSGNFCATLITVREGLRQLSEKLNSQDLKDDLKETYINKINTLTESINKSIYEMDFTFLFDNKKNLFYIGYNVDDARLDLGHYDLLASEARLGSLVAIAKGDISSKHWFSLGRPIADTIGGKSLLSWSGTMFEYLMPVLFTKKYPTTLLSETYKVAVLAQRLYASVKKVPWGISESAYSGVDVESTYQYRAFGVPGLGLKRGLENDLVISPYSTVLSLMISLNHSIKNLKALEKIGLLGEYGFYESVDFTPDRLAKGENSHIIHSFFAHHQGMSFISIVNTLKENVIQEIFHSDPLIKSYELLLQEKFPQRVTLSIPQTPETNFADRLSEQLLSVPPRIFYTPHTRFPKTHVLSNSKITTMIDNAGSGFTNLTGDIALTRWREDLITNKLGTYIFIKDIDSKKIWSAAYQPTCVEPENYEVIFNADKVEIKRRDDNISILTEITIAPDENVEIRRVSVTNLSNKRRVIDLTSYGEVVLNSFKSDQAHPAFSKMFIESEFKRDFDTLIFSRRPRSHKEKELYLFHSVSQKKVWQPVQYETSRMNFIGRNNSLTEAKSIVDGSLSCTTGFVLDPIFSLNTRIELEPNTSETVSFITGASEDKNEVIKLAQSFLDANQVTRAFEMAWSQSSVEIRNEQYTVAQTQTFQTLANALFFSIKELRASGSIIQQNKLTQSGLWRFGISGDLPIILVKINDISQIKLIQELLTAHYYLRNRGIQFDLVIINEFTEGYFQNLQDELSSILRSSLVSGWVDKRGGVFLRTNQQIFGQELILIETISRIVLSGSKGTLAEQLKFKEILSTEYSRYRSSFVAKSKENSNALKLQKSKFYNGIGGFVEEGKGYQLIIDDKNKSPLPWSNVIGQPEFGTLITESGGGYTWAENSRENRLTPWSNDPVMDQVSEAIYISDPESGNYWSATPKPCGGKNTYKVTHGFGYTNFESDINGIYCNYTQTISPTDKVKWYKLTVFNDSSKERYLEVYLYLEWVLGIQREEMNRHLVSGFETTTQTLYAYNNYNNEFAGRCVYIGSNVNIASYTTDKYEFVGRNRDLSKPAFLEYQETNKLFALKKNPSKLSNKVGTGYDSSAVLKVILELKPNEKKDILFYMSQADTVDQLKNGRQKILSYSAYEKDLSEQLTYWDSLTSKITVSTPSDSFNLLMNGWLVYQTISCRINARTAFYQNGGAYGFRDQLQDTLSLLYIDPIFTRNQILLHAKRQFKEGDVQHWWHPPTGRGVRTKISDDLLWLPYVVSEYIKVTNDHSILDEVVPFIEGQDLGDAHEAYIVPWNSNESGTIYEHCLRAINRSLSTGVHGVPFIGCGDWNDGMNEVGKDGKGESVWMGWFLATVLKEFLAFTSTRDPELTEKYSTHQRELIQAIEKNCWDGDWYLRAFFDDGTPLGSKQSQECKIDSLSQSWSIISGFGDSIRAKTALDNVNQKLVKYDTRIIQLLDPPFNKSDLEPGYIKGYLPGVRENGGQYTHAAAWVIIANAIQKRSDTAFKLFDLINPINMTADVDGINRYKAEPYVFCGDVYSVSPHEGRAGWSWYTGSAGWMYQAGIKYILGLRVFSEYFEIDPCIPKEWNKYSITYKKDTLTFEIEVNNFSGNGVEVRGILVEGKEIKEKKIFFENFKDYKNKTIKIEVLL